MFQNMFLSRLLIMMKCRLIRKKKSKWLFNAHTAPDEHEIQCMQMLHLLDFMSIHYMQPHLTTLACWCMLPIGLFTVLEIILLWVFMLCFVRFRAQGFTRGLRSVIWKGADM